VLESLGEAGAPARPFTMLSIETRHFGVIQYREDSVFDFQGGLPGFEDQRQFLLLERPDTRPLVFMQSLSAANLCFIAVPVKVAKSDYELCMPPEDLASLEFDTGRQPEIGKEALCLAIVSLQEDRAPTVNLLSPLVVNIRTRRGIQTIQADSAYSHQHPLLPQEGAGACS
jgi:flagellar assembly factor FliW